MLYALSVLCRLKGKPFDSGVGKGRAVFITGTRKSLGVLTFGQSG